jgi:dephospho-CoA kinase
MNAKNQKMIIGLVGEIASGKGTAAKYLEKKYKAQTIRFSTPLRDVANRLYLEINRSNLQSLSTTLREKFGQDLLAKIIVHDALAAKSNIVVVDGIRRLDDIKHLLKMPQFKLVYITADIKTRFERLKNRNENKDDHQKTFTQFIKDNSAETELTIPLVAKKAKIKIDNGAGLKELHKNLDSIIKTN